MTEKGPSKISIGKVKHLSITYLGCPPPPTILIWHVIFEPPVNDDGRVAVGGPPAMPGEVQLTAQQRVHFRVSPVDADGNPATLDGPITLESDSPNLVTTEVDADGLGGTLHTPGPVGVAGVVIRADARLGTEVVEITDTIAVNVVAGEAANFGTISFDAPESDAPAPPSP